MARLVTSSQQDDDSAEEKIIEGQRVHIGHSPIDPLKIKKEVRSGQES